MKEIRTKQELDEILNSGDNKLVLVKAWAGYCQPCKTLGRTLLDIEGGYANDYIFLGLDCEESDEDLVSWLGVFNLPTVVIFKNGEEVFRRSGLLTRDQLTNLLNELKNK